MDFATVHLHLALRRGLIGTSLLLVLLLLLRYVPFDWPSYAFWTAVVCAAGAGSSVVRPNRLLALTTRGRASLALCVFTAFAVALLQWPGTNYAVAHRQHLLDEVMPTFQFREVHSQLVAAPSDAVWAALKNIRFDDLPVAQALMRIRMAAAGHFTPPPQQAAKPLLDMMVAPGGGFTLLAEEPEREVVLGMVGRPWANAGVGHVGDAAEFGTYRLPGSVRIGFNFRLQPQGANTLLSTETRIAGVDADGTRTFGRYWRAIYPGSAIMRQVWLDSVAARSLAAPR